VKNRFQSLPFKCNLQRYRAGGFGGLGGGAFTGSESNECAMLRAKVLRDTVLARRKLLMVYDADKDGWDAVGLCTLNQVDP
jgi:hypothetical protein